MALSTKDVYGLMQRMYKEEKRDLEASTLRHQLEEEAPLKRLGKHAQEGKPGSGSHEEGLTAGIQVLNSSLPLTENTYIRRSEGQEEKFVIIEEFGLLKLLYLIVHSKSEITVVYNLLENGFNVERT